MIQISYLAIFLCAVSAIVIGMIWYSKALFGNTFMKAIGGDTNISPEKMKEIQKKMWQIFLAQFLLVFLQVYVLWFYVFGAIQIMTPLSTCIWIWIGFIMPTLGGQWLWSARPRKWAWKGFLITSGYNLVLFIAFALILGFWA